MIALDLVIIVPAVFALICAIGGRSNDAWPKWIALTGILVQCALVLSLAPAGLFAGARISGVAGSGALSHWRTATDGLSTPLLLLTLFIGLVAVITSWKQQERPASFFALILALQAAVSAVFLAENILLFYVAWECVLIPMYFLIGGWGSSNRAHASAKYLIYTFGAGAVMLFGVIMPLFGGTGSENISELAKHASSLPYPTVFFWLLMVGFLVKLPVVPLHTWLPDAHTEAPTAGSIILAGVMLKMGGYGIMRIAVPLAPTAFEGARLTLAILGVVGIVFGAAMALTQTDLKRLVAYSSVSHMGFVVLAIAAATSAAFGAALFAMVSHGFVAGLLFLLVGSLYERTHTRELSRMGGLGAAMPMWGVAITFGALASLGLPGLSGFPGEFVTVIESLKTLGPWTLVATVGLALGAAYNLRAVRSTVTGPLELEHHASDLSARELVLVGAFAVAIVAIGVQPGLVLSMSSHAMDALARVVGGGV